MITVSYMFSISYLSVRNMTFIIQLEKKKKSLILIILPALIYKTLTT